MPSSFEHCSICPFALVGAGTEAEGYVEQALVQDHLVLLASEEPDHRADLPEDFPPSRVFAARSCAKWIQEQTCRRYVSLNVRKLHSKGVTVLVVERDDAED